MRLPKGWKRVDALALTDRPALIWIRTARNPRDTIHTLESAQVLGFKGVPIIFTPLDVTIEALSERDLERAGLVRKATV